MSDALQLLTIPFLIALVLTGIHTYLGIHVLTRNIIFVDLALAQISALGATVAFMLGYLPSRSLPIVTPSSSPLLEPSFFLLAATGQDKSRRKRLLAWCMWCRQRQPFC